VTSPAEQPEVIQAETLRNIGCCTLAAATTGREHFRSCVNWLPPAPRQCAVCERDYYAESKYVPGLCQSCGFVAHAEGY
jgi:hypothetical protein